MLGEGRELDSDVSISSSLISPSSLSDSTVLDASESCAGGFCPAGPPVICPLVDQACLEVVAIMLVVAPGGVRMLVEVGELPSVAVVFTMTAAAVALDGSAEAAVAVGGFLELRTAARSASRSMV